MGRPNLLRRKLSGLPYLNAITFQNNERDNPLEQYQNYTKYEILLNKENKNPRILDDSWCAALIDNLALSMDTKVALPQLQASTWKS